MKNIVFIDKKIDIDYEHYIRSLDYDIIKIERNINLYDEISSHTDINIAKIKSNIIAEPNTFEYLNKLDIKYILKGNSVLKSDYPNDICYNVCIVGNIALHNFRYTDKVVKDILEKNNFKLIDVKQGYSNCSTFVIDEKNVITSNREIANKLKYNDINVLLIDSKCEENIRLIKDNKYSKMHGFIGGCFARIDNKCILFGDADKLCEKEKIISFIKNLGYEFIDFKDKEIIDYGGVVKT